MKRMDGRYSSRWLDHTYLRESEGWATYYVFIRATIIIIIIMLAVSIFNRTKACAYDFFHWWVLFFFSPGGPNEGEKSLLRGTIVNRTYGTHNNLYI